MPLHGGMGPLQPPVTDIGPVDALFPVGAQPERLSSLLMPPWVAWSIDPIRDHFPDDFEELVVVEEPLLRPVSGP